MPDQNQPAKIGETGGMVPTHGIKPMGKPTGSPQAQAWSEANKFLPAAWNPFLDQGGVGQRAQNNMGAGQEGNRGAHNPQLLLSDISILHERLTMLLNALKGGGADQVLAKASSTDYDFKWIDVADLPQVDNLYTQTCGILDSLNNATIGAECNESGGVDVSLTFPELPPVCGE